MAPAAHKAAPRIWEPSNAYSGHVGNQTNHNRSASLLRAPPPIASTNNVGMRQAPTRLQGEPSGIVLIAPNVSAQMGGEAMKALQIFEQVSKLAPGTLQITHARNRRELDLHPLRKFIRFVEDDRVAITLWRSRVLRSAVDWWFSRRAVSLAEQIGAQTTTHQRLILHQTEPNSPVVPRAISKHHINIFGPINGNIYYPPCFRAHESYAARARRVLHMPLQKLSRIFPSGLQRADSILAAGGHRTTTSLRAAGVPANTITETLDCGIPDELLDRPRIQHSGNNHRFLHYGRLVFHKGTSLILNGLKLSKSNACLDIIGRGPELEPLRDLASRLGLSERVRFLDWYPDRRDLFASFSNYRAVILPSLEDANGIVVQEAMALGLVPICLDWGGPQLLIRNDVDGFLIAPTDAHHIAMELAKTMDEIGQDGERAEALSTRARERAESWRWSRVAAEWVDHYRELRKGTAPHAASAGSKQPSRL